MAILSNLLVHGSGRILNKLYVGDLAVNGSASFDSISGTSITASSSLVSSGTLSVTGTSTLNGDVTIAAGKKLQLNNTGNIAAASVAAIPLIIGTSSSTHVEYDNDELQSKTNASTTGPLHINRHGGLVYLSTGDKIYANNGTFTASILSAPLITATNVNVSDTLRATRYDLQTIAQTGGSLYVSPTIKFPNSGTLVDIVKPSGATALTITIKDASIDRENMAGAVWTNGSAVKCSGTIDGVITGTMDGTVSSLNVSSHSITIVVSGENWNAVQAGTNIPASKIKDLSVMLYKRHVVDGSNTYDYRVGLWLSCYDVRNNSASIRVYGGSSEAPHVMLGNLTGATDLPQVNDTTPTGWGLFAQNAFLSGTIVSQAGKIGGWTLGENYLHAGNDWGNANSAMLCTGTSDKKSIGGSASTVNGWVFTAGANFGVTSTGALYCNSAHVSGEITATSGKIGNINITTSENTNATTGHYHSQGLWSHVGIYEQGMSCVGTEDAQAFYIVKKTDTSKPWTEANVTNIFHVTRKGHVYANDITIEGNGTIGGCTMSGGVLSVDAAHITSVNASKIDTGTLSASVIGAGSITGDKMAANTITAEKLVITDQTNYVTVTEYDPKSAVTENHPFGEGGDDVVENGYIRKFTPTNNWLALSPFITNSLMPGEELYYTVTLHGDTVGGGCRLQIWFYTEARGNAGAVASSPITISSTDQTYSGTLIVPTETNDDNGNPKHHAFFAIGINDTSDTRGQIYCKQVIVRKKNEGNLIVDGAITADKIATGSISIGAPKNILRGTRTLELATDATWLNKKFRPYESVIGTSVKTITLSDSPIAGITSGILLTADSSHLNPSFAQTNYEMREHIGDVITFSVWVKVSKANSKVRLVAFQTTTSGEAETSTKDISISKANIWTLISYTTNPIQYNHQTIIIGQVKLYQATAGDTCTVCAPMLEYGNTATPWSESSSSDIAGFTVDSSSLHTTNLALSNNGDNSIALSSVDFSRVLTNFGSTAISGLRFAIGDKFGITGDGALYCSNANVSGKITATSGKIGYINISYQDTDCNTKNSSNKGHKFPNSLYIHALDTNNNKEYEAGIRAEDDLSRDSAIFYVLRNNLNAVWNSGDFVWYVRADGYMLATSGKIGGWNIGTNTLAYSTLGKSGGILLCGEGSSGTGAWTDTNNVVHTIGGAPQTTKGWVFAAGEQFGVTKEGNLYCNNANIKGHVEATSGNIGGFEIVDGKLTMSSVQNLLLDSRLSVYDSTTYNIIRYAIIKNHGLNPNDTVTIQIKGSLNPNRTSFYVYNSGNSVNLVPITASDYDSSTGIYTKTFAWKTVTGSNTANNSAIWIYQYPNDTTKGASTIEWVMLEKGEIAHEWKASEDDESAKKEIIYGTQTAATNAWTGKSNFVTALYNGLQIKYWLPYSGTTTAATLNLTLANGVKTGGVACYYGGSNRITTHYSQGNLVTLTYHINAKVGNSTYTGWWADANYNSNTWDRHQYTGTVKTASDYTINASNIIVGLSTGYFEQLNSGHAFDINKPILYAGSKINPGSSGTNNFQAISFNVATTQNTNFTVGKPVYILGTLSGTTFTPYSTSPLTQAIPTTIDQDIQKSNHHYMYLGRAHDAQSIYLEQEHPIYMFFRDEFLRLEDICTSYLFYSKNKGLILSQNKITSETATSGVGSIASSGGNIRLTSTGMDVYQNSNILASYGETITLYHGDTGRQAITLDSSNGLKMYKNTQTNDLSAQLNEDGLIVSSGKIGGENGININSNGIYSGSKSSFASTANGFFIGNDGNICIQPSTTSIFKIDGDSINITGNFTFKDQPQGRKVVGGIFEYDLPVLNFENVNVAEILNTLHMLTFQMDVTAFGLILKNNLDMSSVFTDDKSYPIALMFEDNKSPESYTIDQYLYQIGRYGNKFIFGYGLRETIAPQLFLDFTSARSDIYINTATLIRIPNSASLSTNSSASNTNVLFKFNPTTITIGGDKTNLINQSNSGSQTPNATVHTIIESKFVHAYGSIVLFPSNTDNIGEINYKNKCVFKLNGSDNLHIGARKLADTSTSDKFVAAIYLNANNVYKGTSGSSTSLSDARKKYDIQNINNSKEFIMGLNPQKFKYTDGTSNRYHTGFIAQDVESILNDTLGDSGVLCKVDLYETGNPEDYIYMLRYDEIIAPHVAVTQEHENRINELESEIVNLKKQIKTLKNKLGDK